jgi:ribosomal protein S18 acetylase RimI-like enzyme
LRIGVCPAGPDDDEVVAQLAREAIGELAVQRGGSIWSRREAPAEPLDAHFGRLRAEGDGAVFVGSIDDTPVGYAAVVAEELRDGTVIGRVEGLYVVPGCREVGVGEALMDDVVAWCRDRGCAGVDALVLPGNRETKNFFESYGLTARAIVVHRTLEPGG